MAGRQTLSGLAELVTIERDHYGIPTIQGTSRIDVARATGFLHAQERFFQMDLMRRLAAGELSELFGQDAIALDQERRLHSLRKQAQKIQYTFTPFEQSLLKAYTQGVNAGIQSLNCRPFEYFILREKPRLWKEEDSILVGLCLFFDLQDPLESSDWARGILQASLPPSVFAFFTQNGSAWDAPLDHTSPPLLPIPDAEEFYYLQQTTAQHAQHHHSPPLSKGSNQWATAPSISAPGHALLACDMHLNLNVPNIWYRLAIDYCDETGQRIQVDGISLPGTPLIAVGSNRHIAWGFTNAYVATTDLILLDTDLTDQFYLTPKGPLPFEEEIEEIKVKNAPSLFYKINRTKWGPVHPKRFLEKQVALHWVAHHLDCFNLRLIDLETTTTSSAALDALPAIHLPVLNFMVADQEGHIGWSYVGKIPKRNGHLPGLPVSFTSEEGQWTGFLQPDEYPKVIDPAEGFLWTANNRVLSDPSLGNNYLNPIRAYQIRKRLSDRQPHTTTDMHVIQLDDEAFFFNRWYELLIDHLDMTNPKHRKLYTMIAAWDHHCSASSLGYFWIRNFRQCLTDRIASRLFAPCFALSPDLNLQLLDLEEPFYLIASKQPPYLADPDLGSWKAEMSHIIETMIDENPHITEHTPWGHFNIASIQHPLSEALSLISFFLDMPKKPSAGDYYVPRVSSPSDGASVRFVVSPGREEEGLLSVPCGQSGHPLSKHYRDQHQAWAEGKATPFLPGPPIHRLILTP